MKIILGVLAYLSIVIFNAGFVNADGRMRFPDLMQSRIEAQDNLGFALGWSMLPPAWIITPFVTGLYSRGWTLSNQPLPCTSDSPEIYCKGNMSSR